MTDGQMIDGGLHHLHLLMDNTTGRTTGNFDNGNFTLLQKLDGQTNKKNASQLTEMGVIQK
jgi:hypothetical protein